MEPCMKIPSKALAHLPVLKQDQLRKTSIWKANLLDMEFTNGNQAKNIVVNYIMGQLRDLDTIDTLIKMNMMECGQIT